MNFSGIKIYLSFILTIMILITGCREVQTPAPTQEQNVAKSKKLVEMNRALIRKDRLRILGYMDRNKLEMKETGTGLWYSISKTAEGKKVGKGDMVNLDYTVSLLDGKKCYTSENGAVKSFVVGQGGVESGLEEGILMMHEGDKATFILPPHLAHGLTGDGNKIPARAIIIYEVELISIQ
jgi:FKBP-type peptidyl-prolyl cis-trans isomerase FkpA